MNPRLYFFALACVCIISIILSSAYYIDCYILGKNFILDYDEIENFEDFLNKTENLNFISDKPEYLIRSDLYNFRYDHAFYLSSIIFYNQTYSKLIDYQFANEYVRQTAVDIFNNKIYLNRYCSYVDDVRLLSFKKISEEYDKLAGILYDQNTTDTHFLNERKRFVELSLIKLEKNDYNNNLDLFNNKELLFEDFENIAKEHSIDHQTSNNGGFIDKGIEEEKLVQYFNLESNYRFHKDRIYKFEINENIYILKISKVFNRNLTYGVDYSLYSIFNQYKDDIQSIYEDYTIMIID